MNFTTYAGVTFILMVSLSVVLWATSQQLHYTQYNWQPPQTCQYTSYNISSTSDSWAVIMYGNVLTTPNHTVDNNVTDVTSASHEKTNDCSNTTLKYFHDYYASEWCDEDDNKWFPLPPKAVSPPFDGQPVSNNITICNYTDVVQQLESALYRPFTCSVNQACTRLEPWRSNYVMVVFYMTVIGLEGMLMACLLICIVILFFKQRRDAALRRAFINQPRPPTYQPSGQYSYTIYTPSV